MEECVESAAVCDEPRAGFVAVSKFVVANSISEEIRRAFRERPHLVDGGAA